MVLKEPEMALRKEENNVKRDLTQINLKLRGQSQRM